MPRDTFEVRGPYTDNTFAVVQRIGERYVSHGFFKSSQAAYDRLFQLRDDRRAGAR